MPYRSRDDLPDNVKDLLSDVPHAQDIYKESFNSAIDQYEDESQAHAVALSAVKRKYSKDSDNKWHPRKILIYNH